MVEIDTPEQVLSRVVSHLRDRLPRDSYEEIVPAGSVPLGTYVGHPDLDIFILTKQPRSIHRYLSIMYTWGKDKGAVDDEDLLNIYWVHNLHGYDVDFVIMDPENPKVQTLNHVKYYMRIMDDAMRDRVWGLKTFFKDINCYGAEVGGITGICATRLAEIYPDVNTALKTLAKSILMDDSAFIEDPTLSGRNLFASVVDMKKKIMVEEIHRFYTEGKVECRDYEYFVEHYKRILWIKRRPSLGTDKEFQFVYSMFNKSWNNVLQRVRWWHPLVTWDILMTPWDIYVGYTIEPEELEENAYELIPISKLNEESINKLMCNGGKRDILLDIIQYERQPPFKNLQKEFERELISKLSEKYLTIERG